MEDITKHLIRPTVTGKGEVRAWEEEVMLPTYGIGEEEKNPMFLEKRVYQGSSGVVYPYPVVEKICDEKHLHPWKALFLENEYLKIMILPELGGRIQMAYDKVRERHFVYYNQVIKPALVGLTGPWISGGIEFNWPQHHRPSTYLPTDYSIEEHPDGSITVWCSEIERMFRTKGMQGFTLCPSKAYIEIRVKVFNRTSFPQTFLWWANPAVPVNDGYHSVFPPDVHAVFDHGKRAVSNFPIATGIYYKQDYSAGVDISRYRNIPVPTSYMAIRSKYDFVGGYEQDAQAGLLHVADHHISPGKKQWTWGCGDFGKAWDRNLTDEDGPYIELMTGVYTDNQPDFTWLQPYEEKSWVQYFMPYSRAGYVKNATRDAVVNVEVRGEMTEIILYTTSPFDGLRAVLRNGSRVLFEKTGISVSPEQVFTARAETGGLKAEEITFELFARDGTLMLAYRAEAPTIKPAPEPAKAALLPQEIASVEQLFLTGLHLEQYRHATYDPADYYREALSREPGDVRCNNALGLLLMRKGQFAKAEPHFHRAVETLTERNPNPYDGEPGYNLGMSLLMQGDRDGAYEAFFKSSWNAAWQAPACYQLAAIDSTRREWASALEKIDRSLIFNAHNHKALQLKTSILRKLGRKEEALRTAEEALAIDPFNMGCRFEEYLLTGDETKLDAMNRLMHGMHHSYIEYSLDFAATGLYDEAEQILRQTVRKEGTYPMVYYALGYYAAMRGDTARAKSYYKLAASQSPDRCFPNRIEEVNILRNAMEHNPSDARAPYYLGNFYYAARQYADAVANWERSYTLDDRFPTVQRNLALACYNKLHDPDRALTFMKRAFALDPSDARVFMELDQLYKKTGVAPTERLEILEAHMELVRQRDDMLVELATLYNLTGNHCKAMELIASHKFHPWEGGEGKVTGQYTLCRTELAKEALMKSDFREALRLLHETDRYPDNLGEGKLSTAEENDTDYFKGLACAGLGNTDRAAEYLRKATQGSSEPMQAFFYNDQQPDKIFYQGLAWAALGDVKKARGRFNKLIDHGRQHLFDTCRIDYFAVSMPDLAIWEEDLDVRNRIHCCYVMGLGYFGLGDRVNARKYLGEVVAADACHPAVYILRSIDKFPQPSNIRTKTELKTE